MPDSKPALRKDRVRLIYLLKRRKDMTHEEFSKYWLNVHSKVFIGSRVAHQYTLRYDQVRVGGEYGFVKDAYGRTAIMSPLCPDLLRHSVLFLFATVLFLFAILAYLRNANIGAQMHVSPAVMKAWSEKCGIPATTYDGVALLEADSFEDLEKVRPRHGALL